MSYGGPSAAGSRGNLVAALTLERASAEEQRFAPGQLAVAIPAGGGGFGGDLLLAAGDRALPGVIEVDFAITIDAKNERATIGHERSGALRLLETGSTA
jgi:hypothetical protein